MLRTPTTLYKILINSYGNQNWWPIDQEYHKKNNTDPRFEIMIGAILTQNTAWTNVEKALENLKTKKALDIKSIKNINISTLKKLIQPSGYYNQKADRLKNLSEHLNNKYNNDLSIFFNRKQSELRNELLSLNGIGSETADSILLYAGDFPYFVIDAYTKRLSQRIPFNTSLNYDDIQLFFQDNLKKNFPTSTLTSIYKELHALIVVHAKTRCKKKKPVCITCPIRKSCAYTNE